ncbi:hypothetical protein LP420_33470 [Massilia sp. B-10]|nr:hypothetical protein LP420_33470 [Massilia sp. B-10]
MNSQNDMSPRAAWMLILAASAILMITMGARLTTGLFMSPINTSTGLGIASISFAMAIGQFVWGAAQPVFGAVADKWGSAKVIIVGAFLLMRGTALTPFVDSAVGPDRLHGYPERGGSGGGQLLDPDRRHRAAPAARAAAVRGGLHQRGRLVRGSSCSHR